MSASRASIASWHAERILYDQAGLLVVDKPAGMPTYGGDESLRHGLTLRLGDWLERQGRSPRLGVHQRLDQETSGALLFTTDPAQDEPVRRALEAHTLARTYRAIVHDPRRVVSDGAAELMLDDDGKRSRVVRTGGKRAVTEMRVLERVGTRAEIELQLQTGRLHQIRVTLAHLGAPVIGDRLYGGPAAERLFLHAWRLGGGPLPHVLEAPLPGAFARALRGASAGPTSDAELRRLVRDAALRRAPLLARTNAFRLLHGDAEGLAGITIDVVGTSARIRWDGGAQPSDGTLAVLTNELEALGVLEVGAAPRREPTAPGAAAPAGGATSRPSEASGPVIVEEGAVRAEWASLTDALWGAEPALRPLRERVQEWSHGARSLLALGADVGSVLWVIAAANSSPAAPVEVTLVDRSKTGGARLRAVWKEPGPALRILREEPLAFAERELRRGHHYDLLLVDLTATRGEQGREQLLRSAFALMAPAGRLVVARRPAALGGRLLRRQLHDAATLLGRTIRYAKELPLPFDVPPAPSDADQEARRPLVVELD